jgi:hypothetical protein
LVNEWIPALESVLEKLQRGATVADVGCGRGDYSPGKSVSEIAICRLRLSSTFSWSAQRRRQAKRM